MSVEHSSGVIPDAKQLVRRLVDDVINGRNFDLLDELCEPRLAGKLRTAFEQFRSAFPDWQQDTVELIQEGTTVVARFRCSGTHRGTWLGVAPTGKAMRIDEVYFFRIIAGRISSLWGLEDTWTRMRQLAGDNTTLGKLGSLG